MDDEKPFKKTLTPHQAKLKAESFCAYQERAQQEMRDKLYSWGLHLADVENIIAELISSNFLNEERFACAYVRGKFNIKGWGRIKIKQGLKLKRVSEPLLKIALREIDMDEYYARLTDILQKKNTLIHEIDPYKRRHKLYAYALGKGYENSLITEVLNDNTLTWD